MFMDHAAGFQIVGQYNKKNYMCVPICPCHAFSDTYTSHCQDVQKRAGNTESQTDIHNYIIESYMVHLYTLGERSIFAPCIMHEIQTIQIICTS